MQMTYIKVPIDWLDAVELLGDAEKGRLFTSLLEYARSGAVPQLGGNERFIFPMMRAQIDRDRAEMVELSETRSKAGKKGAEAKQANAEFAKQNKQMPDLLSKTSKCQQMPDLPDLPKTEKREESAPLSPPSLSPPTPPVYSPPYNPPSEKGKEGVRAKRFTPPTLAEVQSYVAERHSPVDPQEFIDFYASKGWMVGKTPMKDWKAACRNAERWDKWAKKPKNQPFAYDYGDLGGSL